MDRPNWKLAIPGAAAAGFVLLGFWGLLVGPCAVLGWFAWRHRRSAGDEEQRLAAFVNAKPMTQPGTAIPDKQSSFEALLKRTSASRGSERFNAYARARLALLENAGDLNAAAEAALLSDRPRDAEQAIAACLASGKSTMAGGIFVYFVEQRTALRLAAAQWDALGQALLAQGEFMEAAWALHAGALRAADTVSAQKRLIEVAARAGAANQPQIALKLYETLLAKYPASQYAQFVRDSIKAEEKKLVKR